MRVVRAEGQASVSVLDRRVCPEGLTHGGMRYAERRPVFIRLMVVPPTEIASKADGLIAHRVYRVTLDLKVQVMEVHSEMLRLTVFRDEWILNLQFLHFNLQCRRFVSNFKY